MKAKLQELLEIPAFADWNMFEGGTAAAPGKKSYGFVAPGLSEKHANVHWSVSPISSQNGTHRGYSLGAFGLPGSPGHQSVSPNHQISFHTAMLFTDPRSAVAVARKIHFQEVSKQLCDTLGVDQKTLKHMLETEKKTSQPGVEASGPSL